MQAKTARLAPAPAKMRAPEKQTAIRRPALRCRAGASVNSGSHEIPAAINRFLRGKEIAGDAVPDACTSKAALPCVAQCSRARIDLRVTGKFAVELGKQRPAGREEKLRADRRQRRIVGDRRAGHGEA